MTVPMDAPRRTISFGPLEITIKRRGEGVRLGVAGSIVVHILILLLFIVAPPVRHVARVREAPPPPQEPHIPITFVEPPQLRPTPPVAEITKRPPPATANKPLRMEPAPESAHATTRSAKEIAQNAGRNDPKPPGGEQGGPKPQPAPGVPTPASTTASTSPDASDSSPLSEPKDILGRLREFKKAVEAPRPSNEQGEEGGGHGRGGISMPNLPATGFGVGNLEFEGRDFDWENYGRQIHGIIWRAWHNRLLVTASVFERWASENRTWILDHHNGVRFTILRSGQVVDVAIETPSGCYPLDDSAVDALKEVVLPPLPSDFTRDSETVHARFIADGEIRVMKSYLQQMKNAGFF